MLEEANLHIAQLNNKNWRSAILNDRLSKRHNDCIGLLKTVAQEQIQRQDELHDLRTLLATAKMNTQHECERHKETEKSLEHEREVTSSLVDFVNRLPLIMSSGTESTISENFSIKYIMELRNLEHRIEQMEEDSQAKDTLIEQLMEEKDEIMAARAASV